MIGLALSFIGRMASGPLQAVLGKVIAAKTDRARIAADVAINRETTRGEVEVEEIHGRTTETVQSITAETAQIEKRPLLVVIAQTVLWAISLSYFGALLIVSAFPLGWEVQRLPAIWEFLTLAILAGLAGPQVLNLLKRRFGL